ncbi:hypothetical protein HKX48_002105 [Thoreauomyces humboldtii]|nr:hypothetical protein HKX48_002105 [Thoreauomyces humboldtii]
MEQPIAKKRGRPPKAHDAPHHHVMLAILTALRDMREKSGRQICELFEDLVSKTDYPEYYAVIKRPVSLRMIEDKVARKQYATLDAFMGDLTTMVENAKHFNRKGSQVYKDATAMATTFHAELSKHLSRPGPPSTSAAATPTHVPAQILTPAPTHTPARPQPRPYRQPAAGATVTTVRTPRNLEIIKLMKTILKGILEQKTSEGRQLAGLFLQLPDREEYPDYYLEIKKPIALDMIQQRVENGLYVYMKEFETDFALMIANALEYNSEESDVYDDALTLQELFRELIRAHHPIGTKGEKLNAEQILRHGDQTYVPGDFVYIYNPNDPQKPTVAQISHIWTKETPVRREGITTCWFLRPEQTSYRQEYRFVLNEVFKTTHMETYFASEIVGPCHVFHIKDFKRGRPRNALSKDVFVCESHYNEQTKSYTKIRNWLACVPNPAAYQAKVDDLEMFPMDVDLPRIYTAFPIPEAAPVFVQTPIVVPSPKKEPKMTKKAMRAAEKAAAAAASSGMAGPGQQYAAATPGSINYSGNMVPGYGPGMVVGTPTGGSTPAYSPFVTPATTAQMFPPMPPPLIDTMPLTSEVLPAATVESFEQTDSRKMKWYAAPPLDVIDNWTAVNSLDYLYKKALEKRKLTIGDSTLPGSGKRLKKLQLEKQKADEEIAERTRQEQRFQEQAAASAAAVAAATSALGRQDEATESVLDGRSMIAEVLGGQ